MLLRTYTWQDLTASQNSATTKAYSFLHSNVAKGTNYYKLLLTDMDGRSSLREIRQLNFKKIVFTVLPNPVVNAFTVSNPFAKPATLVIKNAGSATVLMQEIEGSRQAIRVSYLASGVYFAKLISGQQAEVVRFVKK